MPTLVTAATPRPKGHDVVGLGGVGPLDRAARGCHCLLQAFQVVVEMPQRPALDGPCTLPRLLPAVEFVGRRRALAADGAGRPAPVRPQLGVGKCGTGCVGEGRSVPTSGVTAAWSPTFSTSKRPTRSVRTLVCGAILTTAPFPTRGPGRPRTREAAPRSATRPTGRPGRAGRGDRACRPPRRRFAPR